MKRLRGDLLAVFGYLILAGLVFLPFATGDKAFYAKHPASYDPWGPNAPVWVQDEPANRVISDKHAIIHPDLVHTRREVEAGRTPLWNPHNNAGVPHLANPLTAVFYPLNVLPLTVDPIWSYALLAAIHVFLAALFAHFFLRTIRVRPLAAFLGAVAFSIGGWMTVRHEFNFFVHAYIWLPLALACVEIVLRKRSRWALFGLSVAVGFSILAGFPQVAFNNLVVIAIWSLIGLIRLSTRRFDLALKRAAFLGFFGAVGLGLAAIQLLPTAELSRVSGHKDRSFEDLKENALPPVALLTVAMPNLFGHPLDQHQPNILEYWFLKGEHPLLPITANYAERAFFPGLLVLLLFLVAPFFRRDRATLMLWLLAMIAVALALAPEWLRPIYRIPIFNFGAPSRWIQVAAFAMPMLAALSLDRMLAGFPSERPQRHRSIVFFGVVLLLPFAVLLSVLWIAPNWALPHACDLMHKYGATDAFGLQELTREQRIPLAYIPMIQLRENLTIFVGLAVLALLAFAQWSRPGSKRRWFVVIILLATIGELGWHHHRFNAPVTREGFFTTPAPGVDYLRRNLGDDRFLRLAPEDTLTFLSPNVPQIFELNDAQSFRALTPQSYLEFMRTVEPNPYDVGLPNLARGESLDLPQIDLLRIRYAISRREHEDVTWPKVYPPTGHEGPVDMVIYENPDLVFPAAWLVHQVQVAPPERVLAQFDALKPQSVEDDNPFLRRVWLNELRFGMQSEYLLPERDETVRIVESEPGRYAIEVEAEHGGILVVNAQFAEGWQAWLGTDQGQPREALSVLRANHFQIGIPVDSGASMIELEYQPASFRWGGLITGLSLAFLLISPLLPVFRPRDEEQRLVRVMTMDSEGGLSVNNDDVSKDESTS